MSAHLNDFRGEPISVGDTVVYPGRCGSALWMNEASVLEVTPTGLVVRRAKDGRRVSLVRGDRVAVVGDLS